MKRRKVSFIRPGYFPIKIQAMTVNTLIAELLEIANDGYGEVAVFDGDTGDVFSAVQLEVRLNAITKVTINH